MTRPTVYGINAPLGDGRDIMLVTDSPRSILVLVDSATGRIITASRPPHVIADDMAAQEAMAIIERSEAMSAMPDAEYDAVPTPQEHAHDCANCPIMGMCPLPNAVAYRQSQEHTTHASKGPIGYRVRGTDTVN